MKTPSNIFKEDLKGYFKNLIVVLITVFFLSKNISFSEGILNMKPGKISWFLDIGIYSFLTLLAISSIKLFYNTKRFDITCYFYYQKDYKNDEINIIANENEEIYFYISVKGNSKYMPNFIQIDYSNSIDLQTKSNSAIKVDDDKNMYEIDLNLLFGQQSYVDDEYEIPFDLIIDEELKRKVIKPGIIKNSTYKFFKLKKDTKKFTIIKKEIKS